METRMSDKAQAAKGVNLLFWSYIAAMAFSLISFVVELFTLSYTFAMEYYSDYGKIYLFTLIFSSIIECIPLVMNLIACTMLSRQFQGSFKVAQWFIAINVACTVIMVIIMFVIDESLSLLFIIGVPLIALLYNHNLYRGLQEAALSLNKPEMANHFNNCRKVIIICALLSAVCGFINTQLTNALPTILGLCSLGALIYAMVELRNLRRSILQYEPIENEDENAVENETPSE